MSYDFFLIIIELVEKLGYLGLFIMTFIEGTFIPIPSEITLIPAGYLIAKLQFNFWYVLLSCIAGTLAGSLLNYAIAFYYGRNLITKYGRYLLISNKKLSRIEYFFQTHGPISIFTGRMLPGVKHFISFPAGLGKMNLKLFVLYSTLGATVWIILLLGLGYFIGDNELLISKYFKKINISIIILLCSLVGFYVWRFKNKNKKADGKS